MPGGTGHSPRLGTRPRGAGSDASEYRRAWGVGAAMADRGEAIAHDDLPWPTTCSGEVADMRAEVRRAVLGETYEVVPSAEPPRNARALLRAEMLRWHPDKFDLSKFTTEDRDAVADAVADVTRRVVKEKKRLAR